MLRPMPSLLAACTGLRSSWPGSTGSAPVTPTSTPSGRRPVGLQCHGRAGRSHSSQVKIHLHTAPREGRSRQRTFRSLGSLPASSVRRAEEERHRRSSGRPVSSTRRSDHPCSLAQTRSSSSSSRRRRSHPRPARTGPASSSAIWSQASAPFRCGGSRPGTATGSTTGWRWMALVRPVSAMLTSSFTERAPKPFAGGGSCGTRSPTRRGRMCPGRPSGRPTLTRCAPCSRCRVPRPVPRGRSGARRRRRPLVRR